MKKKHDLRKLLKYSYKQAWLLGIAVLLAVIMVASVLLSPIVIGKAIDLMVEENSIDFVMIQEYLYILIGLAVIGFCSEYFMNFIVYSIVYRSMNTVRKEVFFMIEHFSISYIDQHLHGDLLSRITQDVEQVTDGLLQAFTQMIAGILTILFTLTFMFVISWPIAIVVVCLTPLSLISASLIARFSYKIFKEQSRLRGDMSGYMNEMFENQALVVAYDYQQKNIEKFTQINQELHKYGVRAQFMSALINPTTRFINALVYAAVGVTGAIIAIRGDLTVGVLFVFLSYAISYTKPFNEISGVVAELQNAKSSARRIGEVLDHPLEKEIGSVLEIERIKGDISFKQVYFRYLSNKPLIEDFNLNVKAGQMVAIVGPTGCGKTTLINLLMRFYDVNEGGIFLDDININDIHRDSLRSHIGMVLQDTWLFQGTIFENIAYAKEHATKEEVIEAAKKSYAHDFIMRLPKGYDTIVSDAEGLSIGQKQLLCIARLMLKLPSVLILDEATSNIDTRTEQLVQKAFQNLMIGRTSFVIAHRLQTIQEADIIIVMKNGRLIEQGNHKDLLEQKALYYDLYNSQFTNIN